MEFRTVFVNSFENRGAEMNSRSLVLSFKNSLFKVLSFVALVIFNCSTSAAAFRDPRCAESFGSFPDRLDCGRYVACWDGRGFTQRCGDNMVFNPSTNRCQLGNTCPELTVGAPSSGEFVKLTQGPSPRQGRLLLSHLGRWSYVLATNLPQAVGQLVCEHLGHPSSTGTSHVITNSRGPMPMVVLQCPPNSVRLNQCLATVCQNCEPNAPIATVRCSKESSSRCPDGGRGGWDSWGTACYAVGRSAGNRAAASDDCRSKGGYLLDLQSQSEHEWVSSMLSSLDSSDNGYYTAGQLESDLKWRWREQRSELTYAKWWHGWNISQSLNVPPPQKEAATCLVLRKSYPLVVGATARYDSGFYFFNAEDCRAPKLHVCKAFKKDVGCREENGSTYSGTANSGISGRPCLSWDDPRINSVHRADNRGKATTVARFDINLLGSHNYCRNPDGSASPWCFVTPETNEPCDIPLCGERRLVTISSVNNLHRRSTSVSAANTFLRPFRPTNLPGIFSSVTRVPMLGSTLARQPSPPPAALPPFPSATTPARLPDHMQTLVRDLNTGRATTNFPPQPTTKVTCAPEEYRCINSDICLTTAKLCDSVRQCPQGDDESSCKRFLRDFQSFKGRTLLLSHVTETLRGRDLAVCAKRCLDLPQCKGLVHNPGTRVCELTRIGVASGGLKASVTETFYEVKTRKSSCVGRLQCENMRCVHRTARCDGNDDCGDNSDERNCPRTTQYMLRLVGGSGPHEGNVQLLVKGEWGYICDDNFNWHEADRVCKDLGFADALTFTKNNQFAPSQKVAARGGVRFWLDGVSCQGTEQSFFQCHSRAIGKHNCGPTEVAGVICRTPSSSSCPVGQFQCGQGPVFSCISRTEVCDGVQNCFDGSDENPRLCTDFGVVRVETADQTKAREGTEAFGTVYTKHKGRWGTVCDDGFTVNDAKVICRSLGFDGDWSIGYKRAALGQGTGPILVDEPLCTGTENSVDECGGLEWGVSDCTHSEDVGIFCSDKEELRLVGGSGPHQGRVEVKLSGVWGTICDNDFDDYDASVICHSLGYNNGGVAHKKARFGAGSGVIWLDSLDCTGEEKSIQQCMKKAPVKSECTHMEDASVTCYTDSRAPELDLKSVSSRLPATCGRQSPSGTLFTQNLAKIVGGRVVVPRSTPWSVSLMIREGSRLKHNCGGVIISEDLILTAAHCFRKHPKESYVIRVGEHDLVSHDPGQEDFLIDKLWVHDEFDRYVEFNNDIAVLKVMKKNGRGMSIGNGVIETVCLPGSEVPYSKLRDCTVTGWGTLTENAPAIPQRLPRAGSVKLYDMSTCTSPSAYSAFEVTSGMTCAGRLDGSVDTCTGDSGGPLTCIENGRHVLYGITSWGKGCGRRGQPGMYTKVTKFLRWLNQFVG